LSDIRAELALPDEPNETRAGTRALLEDSPEEGTRLVEAGHPLAGLLWEEWGAELEVAGMDRERFLQITRGYAGEIRLWIMGERPWDHCVAGLAGRVQRRLPGRCEPQESRLASSGVCQ
jgi:hypothetical protein